MARMLGNGRTATFHAPALWLLLITAMWQAGGCAGTEPTPRPAPDGGSADGGGMDSGGLLVCGDQICAPGRACCESCGICVAALSECGGLDGCDPVDAGLSDAGLSDADASSDGGAEAGVSDGGADDGSVDGSADSGCMVCTPPSANCRYERTTCQSCGELVCECGGVDDLPCPATDYCQHEVACGATAEATGRCVSRPTSCGAESDFACGCDGETRGNACLVRAAGSEVAIPGVCPDSCRFGLQAAPVGAASTLFGYRWNGERCEAARGERCVGADCNRLPQTLRLCEVLFADCIAAGMM